MERKGIEVAVGLFVLAGIAVGALLVLKLGQAGSALRTDYEIVVQFPSASGIIKNAKVMMAGVEVGKVTAEPGFNDDRSRARVRIGLSVDAGIREGSKFTIRQQGLLADPYIE
ncbi:MAG: MCE family protein, partial [Verrucomicrobiae bacterium]|nr:MCE family protein [Verrucomicrobiae bacterium]